MRCKFGSIITEGSGSLGGLVIQNSHGGLQARTKPVHIKPPSPGQYVYRSRLLFLHKSWKALPDDQRKVWNDFASRDLSGQNIFFRQQSWALKNGWSLYPNPFIYPAQPPELNLIKNGTFDDSSFWTLFSGWTIAAGKANFLDTVTNRIHQALPLQPGKLFTLSFDISLSAGSIWIAFLTAVGTQLFKAPYNSYLILTNGSYSFPVETFAPCVNFEIWGGTSGAAYSLDNLSLIYR